MVVPYEKNIFVSSSAQSGVQIVKLYMFIWLCAMNCRAKWTRDAFATDCALAMDARVDEKLDAVFKCVKLKRRGQAGCSGGNATIASRTGVRSNTQTKLHIFGIRRYTYAVFGVSS